MRPNEAGGPVKPVVGRGGRQRGLESSVVLASVRRAALCPGPHGTAPGTHGCHGGAQASPKIAVKLNR
ncbi:hypothetical protein NDU88_000855, partial [Pleurodeles waltl]